MHEIKMTMRTVHGAQRVCSMEFASCGVAHLYIIPLFGLFYFRTQFSLLSCCNVFHRIPVAFEV